MGRTLTSRLNVTNLVVLIEDDEVELVEEVLRDERHGRHGEAGMDSKRTGLLDAS